MRKSVDEKIKRISRSKFFIDDVALRIYSSAEHLANSIVDMYQISEEEINQYSKTVERDY